MIEHLKNEIFLAKLKKPHNSIGACDIWQNDNWWFFTKDQYIVCLNTNCNVIYITEFDNPQYFLTFDPLEMSPALKGPEHLKRFWCISEMSVKTITLWHNNKQNASLVNEYLNESEGLWLIYRYRHRHNQVVHGVNTITTGVSMGEQYFLFFTKHNATSGSWHCNGVKIDVNWNSN